MVSLLAGTSLGAVRVLALHQRLKSEHVPLDLLTYNTILVATGEPRIVPGENLLACFKCSAHVSSAVLLRRHEHLTTKPFGPFRV